MDHVEYAYTAGMEEEEVEERLRENRTGVLALADGGDAYAIPLAHHYDGESIYFRLGDAGETTKRRFIESTGTANYVVYDAEPTEEARGIDSWSVVVAGELRRLPEERRDEFDDAEINRRFAPIRVFDETIEDVEITIWELRIERMTGRVTAEQ